MGNKSRKDSRRVTISSNRHERCANPWNGKCENTDIALYIFYDEMKLPICRLCWSKIAEKDIEWGDDIGL